MLETAHFYFEGGCMTVLNVGYIEFRASNSVCLCTGIHVGVKTTMQAILVVVINAMFAMMQAYIGHTTSVFTCAT